MRCLLVSLGCSSLMYLSCQVEPGLGKLSKYSYRIRVEDQGGNWARPCPETKKNDGRFFRYGILGTSFFSSVLRRHYTACILYNTYLTSTIADQLLDLPTYVS
ncbi:hypothetical protein J3E69DRAFT_343540 [Trichoderma sp. SZMC 28015]